MLKTITYRQVVAKFGKISITFFLYFSVQFYSISLGTKSEWEKYWLISPLDYILYRLEISLKTSVIIGACNIMVFKAAKKA